MCIYRSFFKSSSLSQERNYITQDPNIWLSLVLVFYACNYSWFFSCVQIAKIGQSQKYLEGTLPNQWSGKTIGFDLPSHGIWSDLEYQSWNFSFLSVLKFNQKVDDYPYQKMCCYCNSVHILISWVQHWAKLLIPFSPTILYHLSIV